MHDKLLKLYIRVQYLASNEEGQDLIEYALLSALVAVAAIAGMHKVASAVNTLFSNISSSLA
jgi:pilus assembly protein Flp/PilA